MRFLHHVIRTIRANRGAYLVLNAIVYGSVLVGFGAGLLFPSLAAAQVESMKKGTGYARTSSKRQVPAVLCR
jgi:hypothetical protein